MGKSSFFLAKKFEATLSFFFSFAKKKGTFPIKKGAKLGLSTKFNRGKVYRNRNDFDNQQSPFFFSSSAKKKGRILSFVQNFLSTVLEVRIHIFELFKIKTSKKEIDSSR
jgi:hypothetical protein